MLNAPTVIGLETIGDGKHQFKGAFVVSATGDGSVLQDIGELEDLQFSEPIALFKVSKGVVL